MAKSPRKPGEGIPPRPTRNRRKKADDPRWSLQPLHSIRLIDSRGLTEIPAQNISPDDVGLKAYGLASMPSEWVPTFLVVSASCFSKDFPDIRIEELIREAVSVVLTRTEPVIVRSSGSSETARDRGQLISKHCFPHQIVETIR